MSFRSGRHFLQIPGPTNVPERVLRAMDRPTIDHRGPEFAALSRGIFADIGQIFGSRQPVIIFPASGTGAWEAALVNTLAPGDRVLMAETGHFASLWCDLARRLGLDVDVLPGSWRQGVDAAALRARLAEDHEHSIRAVAVVHNETSTGVTSDISALRRALDEARHPALLLVDTISSLASIDYRHDEWGVDVTVAGSQKGLMLPPGLSFNCVSEKALAAQARARLPKSYWAWAPMLAANRDGYFPSTPATNLLYGLRAALDMLLEEGLPRVFDRHARLAGAARAAVSHWGLELWCARSSEYSNTLTAVVMPADFDEAELRGEILRRFDLSLGSGLGKLKGRVFRIGHLGDFNALSLIATLAGVEMGLAVCGVPHQAGGVNAAMSVLAKD